MAGRIFDSESPELRIEKSANSGQSFRAKRTYSGDKPLIFISHRQTDSLTARSVADFLIEFAEVDVYLEAFNPNLTSTNTIERIVSMIDFGLNISTHLLAIVSDNTRGSWWVPYEIGVARNRPIPCSLILLSSVKDLPEYLKVMNIIKDTYRLINWIKDLPNIKIYKSSMSFIEVSIPNLPRFRSEEVNYFN